MELMEENVSEALVTKPKPCIHETLAFDYVMNYLGKDTYKEKSVGGAGISLAILAYSGEDEIGFKKEPRFGDKYSLSDVFKVSFDREKLFVIQKNPAIEELFCEIFDWDRIETKVVGYMLDCLEMLPEDIGLHLPESFRKAPFSYQVDVSEKEFKKFVRSNLDEFDISDNRNLDVSLCAFV